MDFPYSAGAYAYRPLKLKDPMQNGWDVYALQSALKVAGYSLVLDGWFGQDETYKYVTLFQSTHHLTVDGIAGIQTQTKLASVAAGRVTKMDPNRIYGQMEKESSGILGDYTKPYPDQSRDRGVLQKNSEFYPDPIESFDVQKAIDTYVADTIKQHARYVGAGVAETRAWAAAQGYWNNHVYADDYAMGDPVPDTFLAYIAAVTAYV